MMEHTLSEAETRSILVDVAPTLGRESLVFRGRGWDNEVWQVGDHVLRIPMREEVREIIPQVRRVLATLEGHLPVPASDAALIEGGSTRADLQRHLPGKDLRASSHGPEAWGQVTREMGRAIRTLHALSPEQAQRDGWPSEYGRSDLQTTADLGRRVLPRFEDRLSSKVVSAVAVALERPPVAAESSALRPIHGDLHAEHVLTDVEGHITGILDWDDACVGDPACDLTVLWTTVSDEHRDLFLDAYGPIDALTLERARWFSLIRYGLIHGVGAFDSDDPATVPRCLKIMARAAGG